MARIQVIFSFVLNAALICVVSGCSDHLGGKADNRIKNPEAAATSHAREIAALIRSLDDPDFNREMETAGKMSELGSEPVPALIRRALQGVNLGALRAVQVLQSCGTAEALPALVTIADRAPNARFSEEVARRYGTSVDTEMMALEAREAVVSIVFPESSSWEGAGVGAIPGMESFALRAEYQQHVSKVFAEWRAALWKHQWGRRTQPNPRSYAVSRCLARSCALSCARGFALNRNAFLCRLITRGSDTPSWAAPIPTR